VWGEIAEGPEREMHVVRPQADVWKEKREKDLRKVRSVAESGCQQINRNKNMNTVKTAEEIATAINASGNSYHGASARAWEGNDESRIYFGRDYVRIIAGCITNAREGKARALTIGHSAVELVEKFA
jgi:hypothetical protein